MSAPRREVSRRFIDCTMTPQELQPPLSLIRIQPVRSPPSTRGRGPTRHRRGYGLRGESPGRGRERYTHPPPLYQTHPRRLLHFSGPRLDITSQQWPQCHSWLRGRCPMACGGPRGRHELGIPHRPFLDLARNSADAAALANGCSRSGPLRSGGLSAHRDQHDLEPHRRRPSLRSRNPPLLSVAICTSGTTGPHQGHPTGVHAIFWYKALDRLS